MLTNKSFLLTADQLKSYSEWIEKITASISDIDDVLSCEVQFIFTFTSIGRHVIARFGESGPEIELESL